MQELYELCALAIVDGRANVEGAYEVGFDINAPVFSVGTTAQIAQIHSQTLRQYDRLQLIVPQRTEGGARRYSLRDIERLVEAQALSHDEGINLQGIARILSLCEENRQLKREIKRLRSEYSDDVFAASPDGRIVPMSAAERAQRWYNIQQSHHRRLPVGPSSDSVVENELFKRAVIVRVGMASTE